MRGLTKYLVIGLVILALMVAVVGCSRGTTETTTPATGNEDQTEPKADPIVIKFSHVVAESTPKGQAAALFEELAEKYTDGRVDVQVFPNSQLYKDEDVLNAIQQNNVQLAAPATSVVSKLYPEWLIFDLPFAFKNAGQVQSAMEGEVGTQLLGLLEQKNLLGLGMWDNGFKQMSSYEKALIVPEDFVGQKFRVMSSKLLEAQFKAVGASPQAMAFGEVYSALEQRVIDGQENTLSNIYSKKFHEVQKYMTLSDHGYLGYAVITNKEFWNGLPADIREGVEKAMNEATQWVRDNAEALNNEQLDKIKQETPNLEIHVLTDSEKAVWQAKMDTTYDILREDLKAAGSTIGDGLIDAILELRK